MTQEQTETTSLSIDTPSEADAQQAAVDAYLVHCHECVWWRGADGSDDGACHRHAPRPDNYVFHAEFNSSNELLNKQRNWSITGRTDFCGESELKPDAPKPIELH